MPKSVFSFLWFVWAALLTAAIVLGNHALGLTAGHGSAPATAGRMGSSLVLVVVAWLAAAMWRRAHAGKFGTCVAIGMTLGTVGDFFNAGLLNFVGLKDPVLGGIIAFGLGHIAYITGCVDLARRTGLTNRQALLGAILAWQLIGVVAWYFVVMQGTEARALVWPCLPYSLLLAGTAGITAGIAWQDRRWLGLAVGAALFLTSDLILAFELFRGQFEYDTESVWLTYGSGQMLIVFAAAWGLSAALSRGAKTAAELA